MREDTRPETPHAKSNSDPPPATDAWRRPKGGDATFIDDALLGPDAGRVARLDWGMGGGKIRTLQARGPAGWALAVLLFICIGALLSLFLVFALGIGTVVALGAGAVAALGFGGKMLRRRLTGTRQLGRGNH
ncbi:MAG TPA: hypothetical protein VK550_23995 [Polyangiaceae bacterium]|nr:hypothetical protein [Polyangiaceae bacterium]